MARPPDSSRADISLDTDASNPKPPLFGSFVRPYCCTLPLFFDVALSQKLCWSLSGRHKVYGWYLSACSFPQANPTPVRQRRRLSIGQLCGPCLLSRSAKI